MRASSAHARKTARPLDKIADAKPQPATKTAGAAARTGGSAVKSATKPAAKPVAKKSAAPASSASKSAAPRAAASAKPKTAGAAKTAIGKRGNAAGTKFGGSARTGESRRTGERDVRSGDRAPRDSARAFVDKRPAAGQRATRNASGRYDGSAKPTPPGAQPGTARRPASHTSTTDARRPAPRTSLKGTQPVKRRATERESAPAVRGDETGLVRLSKRMSELGLCSRREADEWIEKGWVLVDGVRIDTLGTKVRADQRIEIDSNARAAQAAQVTILLHKPVGYVSGQAEDGYAPAATLITRDNHWSGDRSALRFSPQHLRALAPAGRLDIDSTGLLVLTQNGRIAKQLIGEQSDIDKEYLVRVRFGERLTDIDQHFPAESLAKLRHGLELDGVPLKPATVSWQNGEQLRFVLREGKKRQIRRMCELVGLDVIGLKRVRMGRVMLGALPQGQWRYLSPDESF
ncbi:tRNA pseudouridine synthase A [Burkholderia singularis]|uniref:Dual-specificity RNA pseudouridine synthase RluF n=1 Tax=Burkholderia singularis TaxID=1503053 RepID=A0A238HAK9_9BURK|nr:tRNA pseudouridine synthase A [Burkholderia singularis]